MYKIRIFVDIQSVIFLFAVLIIFEALSVYYLQ